MTARKRWTDYAATLPVQPALVPDNQLPEYPEDYDEDAITRPRILEKDLKTMIYKALKRHPLVMEVYIIGVASGRIKRPNGSLTAWRHWGEPGTPDIVGRIKCDRPKRFRIEVKTPQRRRAVTPEQRERLDETIAAGGLAGVACSVEEALAIVEGRT